MTNEGDIVEIEYNKKKYDIKNVEDEQKVRPKGIVFTAGDEETDENKEIIVKDYKEKFWNTVAEIDGDKVELKWGKGKHLTVWGGGSALLMGIIWIIYSYVYCFSKQKEEIEKEVN